MGKSHVHASPLHQADMRSVTPAALFIAATCLLFSALAHAQTAEELAAEATSAFQTGEFERAAELFERAFELDPHPIILFNLARAYQEGGALPDALLRFGTLDELDAPQQVLRAAEQKIEEIEALLRSQGYDPEVVTASSYVPRGDLTITTQPRGAAVYIDGEYRGETPYSVELVDAGSYSLRIELEGFHPVVQEIEVHGLRPNLWTFNLSPRTTLDEYVPPSPGYLTIRAPVSGLEVLIDDEFMGLTPLIAHRLPPGDYSVRIRGDEWAPYRALVQVGEGEDVEHVARMQPLNADEITDPNRSKRVAGAALMATGGAIIAGGVAMGLVALNASNEYNDDPSDPARGDLRSRAKTSALVADVAYATGAAVVVTGIIYRYVLGTREADVDRELLVRATGGPGFGIGLSARW